MRRYRGITLLLVDPLSGRELKRSAVSGEMHTHPGTISTVDLDLLRLG